MKRRKVVKLTREDRTTRGGFRYEVGVPATAPGGGKLCSTAYLHAYRTTREAEFFRPLHNVFTYDAAWEAEALVEKEDATKLGCTMVTLRKRIALPRISTETRVTAAVLLALDVYNPHRDRGAWGRWAEAWLSGEDRTESAATDTTECATGAAASAAAYAAYAATDAAASAAYAATDAAASAAHAYANYAAADAATSAASAAMSATYAASVDALLGALGVLK